MGIWGLDIYEDDLAKDIRSEFEGYLDDDYEPSEAVEEIIASNEELLEDSEYKGTFILTIALLAKDNDVNSNKIKGLLQQLEKYDEYWEYLKENSMQLYEARFELMRDLM